MIRKVLLGFSITAVLLVGFILLSKRSPQSANQPPTATQTNSSWNLTDAAKPYQGATIRLIGEDYPPLQAIEKMKPDFEKATGIKVEVERYEAEAVLQKINFDLNSKAGRYDLIIQVYSRTPMSHKGPCAPTTDTFLL